MPDGSATTLDARLRWLLSRLPITLGFAILVFMSLVWVTQAWGSGDAIVYLAAGERLNAGHQLYALSPGDRWIWINPPYWTAPILSPPIIAILWQPLAVLPDDLGATIWAWAATLSCAATIIILSLRRPALVGTALVILGVPLGVLMWSGNVDAFRLPATIAVWLLVRRGQDTAAGVTVGFMTAVKLTPALLIVWLWAVGLRRGALLATSTALGLTAAAILIVGFATHLQYLDVVRSTLEVGTAELTLAGVARTLGLAPELARWLPELAALAAVGAVAVFRASPSVAFAAAVIGQVLGAPATGMHTYGLLLAALAPAVFPTPNGTAPSEAVLAANRQRTLT